MRHRQLPKTATNSFSHRPDIHRASSRLCSHHSPHQPHLSSLRGDFAIKFVMIITNNQAYFSFVSFVTSYRTPCSGKSGNPHTISLLKGGNPTSFRSPLMRNSNSEHHIKCCCCKSFLKINSFKKVFFSLSCTRSVVHDITHQGVKQKTTAPRTDKMEGPMLSC